MRTIGTLCALLLCAAFVTAQEMGSAPPQNVASATGPSARSDPRNNAPPPTILETGLLIVLRDVSLAQQDTAQQAQTLHPFPPRPAPPRQPGFEWRPAMEQWAAFLTWQHSVRLFQEKTHNQLGGPFWSDYVRSLEGLHGWWDGDSYATNYLAHPMMGAVAGYIQVHNDPAGRSVPFSRSEAYWRSRGKAFAASAIYSLQFELGPISEASIGNVGLKPGTMAWVDLLVTPLAGVGLMVAEDALDRFVIAKAERRLGKNQTRVLRTFLNPNRSIANIIRFQAPWKRDARELMWRDSARPPISDSAGPRGVDVRR
jgi:hypothetical protein